MFGRFRLRRPVCLDNARTTSLGDDATSLRFGSRILSMGEPPQSGDVVVDVDGAFVLPGLINAHDHLELNHLGRRKYRPCYADAADWTEDMRPRLQDLDFRQALAHSLSDRLFAGLVKNLLSGVTTVAHHNPLYRELRRALPIRVVRSYGWAHSFALMGQPVGAHGERGDDVVGAYRRTPSEAPFLIHLAEGVDERSRTELRRLDELGCLGPTTVIVHGVGVAHDEWSLVATRGGGLVWCPASNDFLLGRTVPVRGLLRGDHGPAPPIALGTDSRLTGSRDLLEELRFARDTAEVSAAELLPMVTSASARLLRLPYAGRLSAGLPADLIVVPPVAETAAESLLACERSGVALVVVGGRALTGVSAFASVFTARRSSHAVGTLDGVERLFERSLLRRLAVSGISEPGMSFVT